MRTFTNVDKEKEAPTYRDPSLYITTPLVESDILERLCGCKVFLKLENLQPGASFKSRGISLLMKKVRLYFREYFIPHLIGDIILHLYLIT